MKIVLSEHCFGSGTYVNGIDLSETEEGLFDPVAQRDARGAILLEIMQNMDNLPSYHWNELVQMAVQNNPRYEINEEESYHDTCEQCGNWNSSTEYNKK